MYIKATSFSMKHHQLMKSIYHCFLKNYQLSTFSTHSCHQRILCCRGYTTIKRTISPWLTQRMLQTAPSFRNCSTSHQRCMKVKSKLPALGFYNVKRHLSSLSSRDKHILKNHSCRKFEQNVHHKYSTVPDYLCLRGNVQYVDYLSSLQSEFDNLTSLPEDAKSKKTTRERIHELTPIIQCFQSIIEKMAELDELDSLIKGSTDSEIVTMATQEKTELYELLDEKDHELVLLLAGEAAFDRSDIILELSAGVGGQEAMLFTREMVDFYEGFADFMGWTFHTLSYDASETGGVRHASASVCGQDVFKHLKFEGGVHRVQRVPQTEKSGRIHTSTMTVAVLPQPKDIDISINPKDLVIDTFRASGKGGQHVNTTDSAVRITHVPTKTVAECQVERSQMRNKELAMQILRSRLYEAELRSQTAQTEMARKLQTGSAGRSEKIRTYNYPQDRITDHRLGENVHNIGVFMKGGCEMEDLLDKLMWKVKCDVVEEQVEDFVKHRKSRKS